MLLMAWKLIFVFFCLQVADGVHRYVLQRERQASVGERPTANGTRSQGEVDGHAGEEERVLPQASHQE